METIAGFALTSGGEAMVSLPTPMGMGPPVNAFFFIPFFCNGFLGILSFGKLDRSVGCKVGPKLKAVFPSVDVAKPGLAVLVCNSAGECDADTDPVFILAIEPEMFWGENC